MPFGVVVWGVGVWARVGWFSWLQEGVLRAPVWAATAKCVQRAIGVSCTVLCAVRGTVVEDVSGGRWRCRWLVLWHVVHVVLWRAEWFCAGLSIAVDVTALESEPGPCIHFFCSDPGCL